MTEGFDKPIVKAIADIYETLMSNYKAISLHGRLIVAIDANVEKVLAKCQELNVTEIDRAERPELFRLHEVSLAWKDHYSIHARSSL